MIGKYIPQEKCADLYELLIIQSVMYAFLKKVLKKYQNLEIFQFFEKALRDGMQRTLYTNFLTPTRFKKSLSGNVFLRLLK